VLIDEIDSRLSLDTKDDAKEKRTKRQANAAVALLRMNKPTKVWPLLKHSPDPTLRSYLIHRFAPLDVDARALVKQLDEEPDTTIRRALLLSLGEFGEGTWSAEERAVLLAKLQEIYRTAEDAGMHAAVEWLLRQPHWQQQPWLRQTNEAWAKDKALRAKHLADIQQDLAKEKGPGKAQWYVNGQGQTMVVIPGPVEFVMGSPPTEKGRDPDEPQHRKRISRSFALASKPVTVREYLRHCPDHEYHKGSAPDEDCPVHAISWYMAAAYCNWLSEQEGIPPQEWCYETSLQGRVRLKKNYLKLTGYRLPTEAEWEYACRAGTVTAWCYGDNDELRDKYGWHLENSQTHSWPVGSKKPNDWGLFDMHGNVWTWCQDRYWSYPQEKQGPALEDREDTLDSQEGVSRVIRGGAFVHPAASGRSATRSKTLPHQRFNMIGLRPARTLR
jgi:formylglycine-generating enzyme required for sulfatase activity